MTQTFTIARQGAAETYRYQVGRAQWDGQEANIILIHAFPNEGGTDVGVDPPPLRDGILANHPELTASANPLVVVIKTPSGVSVARWRLVSLWPSGGGPDLRLHSDKISEANAAELERVFGP